MAQKSPSEGTSAAARPGLIALAGNPNSGKTTIFNALTGLRQKVGNYPGVTVEKKVGTLALEDGSSIEILDLPGAYSLSVRSPDERITRDVLLGRVKDTPRPDTVVCIVDASNLERNLYFVSQIMDLGGRVVVALNMMDVAEQSRMTIDVAALESALGVPCVPMVASRGEGLPALKDILRRVDLPRPARGWRMSAGLETAIAELASYLREYGNVDEAISFSEAMILLNRDPAEAAADQDRRVVERLSSIHARLAAAKVDWRAETIEARYAWLGDLCARVVKRPVAEARTVTDKLDEVLTHRVWGWFFFLGVMATMFFMIFSVAEYPMGWIESVIASAAEAVRGRMAPGDLRDLVTDGVFAGVGSVIVFLPQILILFFFIGLLEDSGYMPRAAFIIDRLMSRVGLHGKSFIPLLSSFACAIPGIMATRTIENRKDRLVTILVAPLMSCSARVPVYTVMIATLLPSAIVPAWQKALIMLSMYMLGMVTAFVMAWVFKRGILKGETPVLIMELPPYRVPVMKAILLHMWTRSSLFLKRAGTIILCLSILLWALMTYPKGDSVGSSFAGMIGHALEPVIKPLGYDWRIGVGLVGSFAAREVFVSTMSIVFSVEGGDEEVEPLREAFLTATWPDGRMLFTPLVCVGLMVFYVLAMQCVSTVAIVRRETNSWKWPLFQLAYMTGLAYLAALIVFQGGRIIGFN